MPDNSSSPANVVITNSTNETVLNEDERGELESLREEVKRLKRKLEYVQASNISALPTMNHRTLKRKNVGPKVIVRQTSSILNPQARKRANQGPRWKHAVVKK